jgi:hypothetical protein
MQNQIIGWILIVVGILFVLLAVVGAAIEAFREFEPPKRSLLGGAKDWADFLTALTKLIATLFSGPRWFLRLVVGVLLIYGGECVRLGHLITLWNSG